MTRLFNRFYALPSCLETQRAIANPMTSHKYKRGETSTVSDGNNLKRDYFSCDQENLSQTPTVSQTHIADSKSQLQQWLDAESTATKKLSKEAVRSRLDRTISVVSSVWDLWSLVTKEYNAARKSVEWRIATLMGQLDTPSKR
ncbi:hypothetical protein N7453_004888 [Penicillium expansum]|nr:hypothetical protein N7453_004888 [Penicillium expansum]